MGSISVRNSAAAPASHVLNCENRATEYFTNDIQHLFSLLGLNTVYGKHDYVILRRGHRYITLFVDADTNAKTVLFMTEGKGRTHWDVSRNCWSQRRMCRANRRSLLRHVPGIYFEGIEDFFPKAEVTFDKFHIMKLVYEAVDDVRIAEQKQTPALKHTKYIGSRTHPD